jgi:CDP-glucose 4,6-dehydratase
MDIWCGSLEGMVMGKDFWGGKRVLITGHTGFKGGWLSLWLQSMGAQVTGYALPPPTTPSFFDLARVSDGMISVIGDIRDLDGVRRVMATEAPELVFHLAAQPLVRYSYQNPIETYATNVLGTAHVLQMTRETASVKAVVVVTSDKCYENQEWVWGYRESDPMGGYDPYSSSKGCAELITAAYRRSYCSAPQQGQPVLGIASVRAGNVIGGGDWAEDRLVPDSIRAFKAGRPLEIRNPRAVRPWQHVLEPLYGYLQLARRLYAEPQSWGEAWNFGPNDDDAKPVSWIVGRISELWGEGASWRAADGQHPHEAHYLKLDISKAKSRLDWSPRWDLERTLESTVEWYKAHAANKDMRDFSMAQIRSYQA